MYLLARAPARLGAAAAAPSLGLAPTWPERWEQCPATKLLPLPPKPAWAPRQPAAFWFQSGKRTKLTVGLNPTSLA